MGMSDASSDISKFSTPAASPEPLSENEGIPEPKAKELRFSVRPPTESPPSDGEPTSSPLQRSETAETIDCDALVTTTSKRRKVRKKRKVRKPKASVKLQQPQIIKKKRKRKVRVSQA